MDGVMETIWGLLSEGRPSREVIAMGFAPRTVFAVPKSLRRRRNSASSEIVPSPGAAPETDLNHLEGKAEALEARASRRETVEPSAMKISDPDEVREYIGPASESDGEEVGDVGDIADVRDPDKADKSQVDEGDENKDDDALSGWFPFRVSFLDD